MALSASPSGGAQDLSLRIEEDEITLVKLLSRGAYGRVYVGEVRGAKFAVKVPYLDQRKMLSKNLTTKSAQHKFWVQQVDAYLQELRLMRGLSHPNIASVTGATTPDLKSERPQVKIVMELMSGDLERLVLGKEIRTREGKIRALAQWCRAQDELEQRDVGYTRPSPPEIWRETPEYADIPLVMRLIWAYQASLGVAWLHKTRDHSGNPRPVIHRDLKLASMCEEKRKRKREKRTATLSRE
jgi:serine/threonine protein kinase